MMANRRNSKDSLRCTSPRDDDLESAAVNVLSNNTEDEDDDDFEDDFEELALPPPPKIDISTLKNEILTDGMKVSAAGGLMHVNRGRKQTIGANHMIVPRGSSLNFGGMKTARALRTCD